MLNFPLTRRAFVAGTAATALALAGCSVEQPIEPGPAPADPADDNACLLYTSNEGFQTHLSILCIILSRSFFSISFHDSPFSFA